MRDRNSRTAKPRIVPSELQRPVEIARRYVLAQITDFERVNLCQVPFYGRQEDLEIAAYVWGFVDGHQQVSGDDAKWAGPERQAEALALIACGVVAALFGPKRHARLVERLPMLAAGRWPSGLDLDERVHDLVIVGGTDGMDCAEGRASRWPLGGLHDYLGKNVEPKWRGLRLGTDQAA